MGRSSLRVESLMASRLFRTRSHLSSLFPEPEGSEREEVGSQGLGYNASAGARESWFGRAYFLILFFLHLSCEAARRVNRLSVETLVCGSGGAGGRVEEGFGRGASDRPTPFNAPTPDERLRLPDAGERTSKGEAAEERFGRGSRAFELVTRSREAIVTHSTLSTTLRPTRPAPLVLAPAVVVTML